MRGRHLQIVLIGLGLSLLFCLCVPAAYADYFVSATGKDTWSGTLAAPNATKTDGPFASIERACAAARTSNIKSVQVRGGSYFLAHPIVLTPIDSELTLTNYPGERPLISAGRQLTGWRKEADGSWSAAVPEGVHLPVRLLRTGEHWLVNCRYPSRPSQWLFAQPAAGEGQAGEPKSSICFSPGALKHWQPASGMEVVIFPEQGWFNEILSVTGIDYVHSRIQLDPDRNASAKILPGNRFYLRNIRAEVRDPGSWCFDAGTKRIYLVPPAGCNKPENVFVPVCDCLFQLEGDWSGMVRKVTISGFELSDTFYAERQQSNYVQADAAIKMDRCDSCSVANNNFHTLGGYAVRLGQMSQGNTIDHNAMHELGAGGVLLLGDNNTEPHHNKITCNRISQCGTVFKHIAGVMGAAASETLIAENLIEDMPRYGISLKCGSPDSICQGNIIRHNRIINTSRETHDSGAIEVLGRGKIDTKTLIQGNYISGTGGTSTDSHGNFLNQYQTWGIYLDDYASGVTISGNVFSNCSWSGVFVHGGKDNEIDNNLFVANKRSQIMAQACPDRSFFRNNRFLHNIVVFPNSTSTLLESLDTWDAQAWASWNNNLYWYDDPRSAASRTLTPEGDFTGWQKAGRDRDSRFANPLLKQLVLQPKSPAFQLGIKQFHVGAEKCQTAVPVGR